MNIQISKAQSSDFNAIKELFIDVAMHSGGIARQPDEITDAYITMIMNNALQTGCMLVVRCDLQVVASIHAFRLEPRIFKNMLAELVIVVHSAYQGKGIGRKLFTQFLETVQQEMPTINRIELKARESNSKAIELYKTLGFVIEGRLEQRIVLPDGSYEADIQMAWIKK